MPGGRWRQAIFRTAPAISLRDGGWGEGLGGGGALQLPGESDFFSKGARDD